jgi:predicted dehydrogenase
MEQVGARYGVPKDSQYVDYKKMIDEVQPDIVSVATQPEQRAEIVGYAATHGVRAIYAEKAMAASMAEVDAMVEVCERNAVHFNLGTNRRWDPGFDAMKAVIDGGELGALRSLIIHDTGSLFNGASHSFDLVMRLNSDAPAQWVQGQLQNGDEAVQGGRLVLDPVGHGMIQFENGVTAYALNSGRRSEWEAVCERGVLTALANGAEWQMRVVGTPDHRGRPGLVTGAFPPYEHASSTLRLVEDLVHSLDTGEPPRGGVRNARASTELIFGLIESHLRGGARVDLPLEGSAIRLERGVAPRQPTYQRDE